MFLNNPVRQYALLFFKFICWLDIIYEVKIDYCTDDKIYNLSQ